MALGWTDDLGVTDDPDEFKEAIAAFRRKVPISDDDWKEIEDEERARAFKVANVTQANLVQEVFDALDSAIENGTTLEDFKADVGEQLAEAWEGEDPARLETVFRTNVLGAYNQGRYEIFTSPEAKEARPYWRYELIEDGRECEICEPCANVVLPQDDPFWSTNLPPQHPNCRCSFTALTEEEATGDGVSGGAPDSEAADGFGGEPSTDDWEPDTSRFDDEIAAALNVKLD